VFAGGGHVDSSDLADRALRTPRIVRPEGRGAPPPLRAPGSAIAIFNVTRISSAAEACVFPLMANGGVSC
jgi:hypothetical protein